MVLPKNDLDKYLGWIKEGKSFSEIREDLARQNYSPEQIKEIIVHIDEAALQQARHEETAVRGFNFKMMGWIALGVGVAIYAWLFFLNEQYLEFDEIKSVITMLVSGGAALLFFDYRLKRKTVNIQRPGKRKFKLNR
jgi:hypothetical protein